MVGDVFITCAVTGKSDTTGKNPNVPVTPEEIAASALNAARAGASIVHLHARDPKTRQGVRDVRYFKEIVRLIRNENSSLIINLTGGDGGSWQPTEANPADIGDNDVVGPRERIAHAVEIKPDICTLDCGVLNYGNSVYVATPLYLKIMAEELKRAGVRPELELFELGHQQIAMDMAKNGLCGEVPIYQFCLGIPNCAPANVETVLLMRNALPPQSIWSAFGISRMQMPMVAQSVLLGGNVRVGLEDNLYLGQGVPATNEMLVAHACGIIESLGGRVLNPNETRKLLKLRDHNGAT